jgi:hypothetical protein
LWLGQARIEADVLDKYAYTLQLWCNGGYDQAKDAASGVLA